MKTNLNKRQIKSFSPEMNLILACCQKDLSKQNKDKIRSLSQGYLDWEKFLVLVNRHQIFAAAYLNLKNHASYWVPEKYMHLLKEKYRIKKLTSMMLASELIRLSDLLKEKGINAIILKGLPLSQRLYGNTFFRYSKDIDLLIMQKHLFKTHNILITNGFHPRFEDIFQKKNVTKAQLEFSNHLDYQNPKNSVSIEIHYRLLKNPNLFPLAENSAWMSTLPMYISNKCIHTLSDDNNFLYLLAHGSSHQWYLLKWLLDIIEFSKKIKDWKVLAERILTSKLERITLQAFHLAHFFFGVPTPEFPLSLLNEEKKRLVFVDKIVKNIEKSRSELYKPGRLKGFALIHYRSLLKKDIAYKVSCLKHAFQGVVVYRNLLELPDRLHFLYYILLPFLWIYKYHIKKNTKSW